LDKMNKFLIVLIALLPLASAFVIPTPVNSIVKPQPESSTSLNAHHVQKKVTKKMQHYRPKKHRLSDINRKNVNLHKCITKVEGAPSEYTMISADDYSKVRDDALKFWESGDSAASWLEILPEDMELTLPQNIEPLPEGGVQKRPPLVKSGTC